MDVDFVKHGVGVGTTWAYRAQTGDHIHFYGPSLSRALPHDASWLLVAGDDTALPAMARLLEELPQNARGQVFIEIAEASYRLDLKTPEAMDVTWLVRNDEDPRKAALLLNAVKNSVPLEGKSFAWLAGEHAAVRDLRRHLVEDQNMCKEDIEFTGYWRRSNVVALDHDHALPDPKKSMTPFEKLHQLTELISPIAIRTAVELGIPELISRGITDVMGLAASSGSDKRALGKLLRYLQSIDILTVSTTERYGLAPMGEVLTNESVIDALHPAGVRGREMLGIFGLTESIRTGRAAYTSVTGKPFSRVRTEQEYEDRYLEYLAPFQTALAKPIANSGILDGLEHRVIHSGGAGVQAREFTAAYPRLHVTICALPAQADWLRRDLPMTIPHEQQRMRVSVVEQSVFEPSPAANAVFISRAFRALPDADAAHAIRRAAQNLAPGGQVLLVEETFNLEDLNEHDGEADLLTLSVHGSGMRTGAELDALIAQAGLVQTAKHSVGWGTTLHQLVRADTN